MITTSRLDLKPISENNRHSICSNTIVSSNLILIKNTHSSLTHINLLTRFNLNVSICFLFKGSSINIKVHI